MKISVVVVIVAICVCLIEAKHIRSKRSVSKTNWKAELTRDLEGLQAYLEERQEQTQQEDEEHVCEKEITDDIRRKVQNRSNELIQVVKEFIKEINNTVKVFTEVTHNHNLTAGIYSTVAMCWSMGQTARTQRGAEFVGAMMEMTIQLSILGKKGSPKFAELIIHYVTAENLKMFHSGDDISRRKISEKRESTYDKSYSNDTDVNTIVHIICEAATLNWREMEADMDAVLEDGIQGIRYVTRFLKALQQLMVETRDERWVDKYLVVLHVLAYFDAQGNSASFNQTLQFGKKILYKSWEFLQEFQKYYEDSTMPPPPQSPTPGTSKRQEKRVFTGLTSILQDLLKDHNRLKKRK